MPGDPRLNSTFENEDVDGRVKPGHDSPISSHPAGPVIDRRILILRLLLLTLLLPGAVAAIEATGGRAEHAMVTSVMTGDAADHSTLQATLGLGGAGRRESERCGDS